MKERGGREEINKRRMGEEMNREMRRGRGKRGTSKGKKEKREEEERGGNLSR